MGDLRVKKCEGEGQGSCTGCDSKGLWNRHWMCFLFKIEGHEGCYCFDCATKILAEENVQV